MTQGPTTEGIEPVDRWVAAREGSALYINASAVSIEGQGLLLLGAPGSGKSSLALNLLGFGAQLISDDGIWIEPSIAGEDQPAAPHLLRPAQAPDLIEARGVGLLRSGPVAGRAALCLAVDLDRAEPERLPPRRMVAIGVAQRPLILGGGHPSLAAALVQMVRFGRETP